MRLRRGGEEEEEVPFSSRIKEEGERKNGCIEDEKFGGVRVLFPRNERGEKSEFRVNYTRRNPRPVYASAPSVSV